MRSLTTPQTDALAAQGLQKRGLILLEFASGNYGFWDGTGPLSWNGFTFNGGGQVFEIERDAEREGFEANGLRAKLYAVPGTGLTPDVLATIYAENYRRRPVTLYEAYFSPDTLAMIGSPVVVYRGLVQAITTNEDSDRVYLEARIDSRNILNTSASNAMSNAAHHALVSPGDKIFEYAGVITSVPIFFGQPVPSDWKVERSSSQ